MHIQFLICSLQAFDDEDELEEDDDDDEEEFESDAIVYFVLLIILTTVWMRFISSDGVMDCYHYHLWALPWISPP